MPLVKGKSEKAFEHNLKAEMHAGKPQKQSLAIAYAMKRKAEHKAHGGECDHGGPERCMAGCYEKGGEVGVNKTIGIRGRSEAGSKLTPAFSVFGKEHDVENAKEEHRKTLDELRSMKKPELMAEGGEMKSKRQRAMEAFHMMAEGGIAEGESRLTGSKNARTYSAQSEQKGVNTPRMPYPRDKSSYGESHAGYSAKGGLNQQAKEQHKKTLSEMQSMPKPKLMAEGGYIGSYQSDNYDPDIDGDLMPEAHLKEELAEHVHHEPTHDSHIQHAEFNQEGEEDEGEGDMDAIHPMVRRIMMGRAQGYSKGGVVANEDQGESASSTHQMAKWKDNEFDDLALRNDDMEDADYTGANSGDEDGDAAEEHDRNDMVSRIMKSQAKKDRMAVPGEGSTYGKRK